MNIEVEDSVELKEPLVRDALYVLYPDDSVITTFGTLPLSAFLHLFESGHIAHPFEKFGKKLQMAAWACLVYDAASDAERKAISNAPKTNRRNFLNTLIRRFPYNYISNDEVISALGTQAVMVPMMVEPIVRAKTAWLLYGYSLNKQKDDRNQTESQAVFQAAAASSAGVQHQTSAPTPPESTVASTPPKRLNLRRVTLGPARKEQPLPKKIEESGVRKYQKSLQAFCVAKKKKEEAYSSLSTQEVLEVRGTRGFIFSVISLFFILLWAMKNIYALHDFFISAASAQEGTSLAETGGQKAPFVPPFGIPHDIWVGMLITMFVVILTMAIAFFYKGYFAKEKSEVAASWSERFLSAILGMIVGKAI